MFEFIKILSGFINILYEFINIVFIILFQLLTFVQIYFLCASLMSEINVNIVWVPISRMLLTFLTQSVCYVWYL